MKSHPIIMSGDSVRAILEGRKTQTRRVIKPQPPDDSYETGEIINGHPVYRKDKCCTYSLWIAPDNNQYPYGQVGDQLWVRETYSEEVPMFGYTKIFYKADNQKLPYKRLMWKSPRFMPRWASRITLKITKIRVERVQGIRLDGINAEGIGPSGSTSDYGVYDREQYEKLWNKLNAKRGYGWNKNPFVWVIEFKEIKR